ncbi:MAG: SIMPL domain-containing protein [Devosia sp.]
MRLIALAPFTLAALIASPAFAAGSMQMTGHGEVMGTPDTAYITSGVTSQGATAKEALDANTADMTALISTLKAAGIDDKDIQTSGFSVNPNYVYSDTRDANGYQLPPKIVGYTVTNSVTVHVRKLDGLGTILDQSVEVGANTINGISFAIEDPSKLYDEARKAAFADAKHRADLYAEAAGVELGAIASINESSGYTQPPQPYMAKAMAADMASAPVPVQAGQLTYSIDVNVTWDLEQPR